VSNWKAATFTCSTHVRNLSSFCCLQSCAHCCFLHHCNLHALYALYSAFLQPHLCAQHKRCSIDCCCAVLCLTHASSIARMWRVCSLLARLAARACCCMCWCQHWNAAACACSRSSLHMYGRKVSQTVQAHVRVSHSAKGPGLTSCMSCSHVAPPKGL
jgi:hypothetical protein